MHFSSDEVSILKNPFLSLDASYYLGFNRCAYGDSFSYRTLSGRTIYSGPHMFAVDEKCKNAFWLGTERWVRYTSAKAIECD